MTALRIFTLRDPAIRERAAAYIRGEAPADAVVTVKPATRTSEQSAKFHAICGDLARAGAQWAGKPRNAAEWKVLLVSGHAVATKEGAEVIPGLEGEFINVRESTAAMSKARGASLIEYAQAFAAQHLGQS